jgi:hypothetical protein
MNKTKFDIGQTRDHWMNKTKFDIGQTHGKQESMRKFRKKSGLNKIKDKKIEQEAIL